MEVENRESERRSRETWSKKMEKVHILNYIQKIEKSEWESEEEVEFEITESK